MCASISEQKYVRGCTELATSRIFFNNVRFMSIVVQGGTKGVRRGGLTPTRVSAQARSGRGRTGMQRCCWDRAFKGCLEKKKF